jgi:hypothetical protein
VSRLLCLNEAMPNGLCEYRSYLVKPLEQCTVEHREAELIDALNDHVRHLSHRLDALQDSNLMLRQSVYQLTLITIVLTVCVLTFGVIFYIRLRNQAEQHFAMIAEWADDEFEQAARPEADQPQIDEFPDGDILPPQPPQGLDFQDDVNANQGSEQLQENVDDLHVDEIKAQ